MSNEDNNKETELECQHPVERSQYLETFVTPHVTNTDTMSVAQSLFICQDCGKTHIVFTQISRSYLADGTIPPEMQKHLEKLSKDKAIKAEAELMYKRRVADERAKSRQAQTAPGPLTHN